MRSPVCFTKILFFFNICFVFYKFNLFTFKSSYWSSGVIAWLTKHDTVSLPHKASSKFSIKTGVYFCCRLARRTFCWNTTVQIPQLRIVMWIRPHEFMPETVTIHSTIWLWLLWPTAVAAPQQVWGRRECAFVCLGEWWNRSGDPEESLQNNIEQWALYKPFKPYIRISFVVSMRLLSFVSFQTFLLDHSAFASPHIYLLSQQWRETNDNYRGTIVQCCAGTALCVCSM